MQDHKTRSISLQSQLFVRFIIPLLLLFGVTHSIAQNTHFSTYQYSPLKLNPAFTGDFSGLWRASATYRSQETTVGSTFSTIVVGADSKLPVLKNKLAAGLYFLNDNTGVGRVNSTKVYGSIAYAYSVGENHFRGGVQAGYVSKQIASWGNWDHATHSYSADNGEAGLGESIGYLDVNAGVSWKRLIGMFEPTVALSMAHLNQPNSSFLQGTHKEEINSTALVLSKVHLNDNITIEPAFILSSSAGVMPTMLGMNGYYIFSSSASIIKNINAGVHARNGLTDKLSGITILAGTRIGTIDIIAAYDMHSGNFKETTGSTGAIEISLVYRQIPFVLNSYSIPCERY